MAIIIVAAKSRISDSGFGSPDPPLSEEELRQGAARVGDGMRFLRWLSSHVFDGDRAPLEMRRAILECWVMHASRLHGFYYGPRHTPRALLAQDYFPDPETWYEARPVEPSGLGPGKHDIPSAVDLVAFGPEGWERAVPRGRRLLELSTGLTQLAAAFLGQIADDRLEWFAPRGDRDSAWWADELDGDEVP